MQKSDTLHLQVTIVIPTVSFETNIKFSIKNLLLKIKRELWQREKRIW